MLESEVEFSIWRDGILHKKLGPSNGAMRNGDRGIQNI
jgi:hypothetical protein